MKYKVVCRVHGWFISDHRYCLECYKRGHIPQDVMEMYREDEAKDNE